MTVYGRTGDVITLKRIATLEDFPKFETRPLDARDREAFGNLSYVIAEQDDGTEALYHLAFVRASGGAKEIDDIFEDLVLKAVASAPARLPPTYVVDRAGQLPREHELRAEGQRGDQDGRQGSACMSEKDNEAYVPVTGFSIPFKRVLEAEERPANPDGSRSGSLFMTIEGCSYEDKEHKVSGGAAATCGAPNVVITVKSEDGRSSQYLVEAREIITAAIEAHLARKDWPDARRK